MSDVASYGQDGGKYTSSVVAAGYAFVAARFCDHGKTLGLFPLFRCNYFSLIQVHLWLPDGFIQQMLWGV